MIQTKPCTKCERVLPLAEFHADKRRKFGVGSECRDCKRVYRRENRDRLTTAQMRRRSRKRDELRPKRRAWNAIYYAVRTGKMERPNACAICERVDDNIQAHHEDYSRPLDVVWVCQWCHSELDAKRREAS